jgi:hypothetical protein
VRQINEPGFRPGSFVPIGDWRLSEEGDDVTPWDRFENGKPLHQNIALLRVTEAMLSGPPRTPDAPRLSGVGDVRRNDVAPDLWCGSIKRLQAVCKRLGPDEALEEKGLWRATGGGMSLSTTRDRRDGKLIGLHIDRWEQKSLALVTCARNRVCLNMGPGPRWLVFAAVDIFEVAASFGIDRTVPFSTTHAQAYLSQHPMTPVYRLRIEAGEAYVAPTERLIHDGQASSSDGGEWVYTIFGRFDRTQEARQLSAV